MDPAEFFSFWAVEQLGLEGRAAEAVQFFIYDSIKILVLLFVMIFIMGIVRSYIDRKKMAEFLGKKIPVVPNLFASGLGAITPFCSCSSVPIFLGFVEGGIPLGVSFSFLITSPLVNEYVAVMMFGFFGFEITAAYIAVGIVLGVVAGMIIGKAGMEKYIVKDLNIAPKKDVHGSRIKFAFHEAVSVIKKLWIFILFGVGIGALIHGFVPDEAINSLVESGGILAVPLAVLAGVPVYANCSAVVPIAAALFQKGIPLGTALAFMMAVSALSLPEAIMLRRAMKLPLIALFFGIITIGIIIIGYLFNAI